MESVKRCRNLTGDVYGDLWCRSAHICYKPVCYCDAFVRVYQGHGCIKSEKS